MTTLRERLDHLCKIAWNTPEATVAERAVAQEEYSKLRDTREFKAMDSAVKQLNAHTRWQTVHELQENARKANAALAEHKCITESLEFTVATLGAVPCPKVD